MADITLEQFESEARAFLEANAPRKEAEEHFEWGKGSDKVALFDEKSRDRELDDLKRAQAWRATKFDAGFGWIGGPAAFGGRQLPHAFERAWGALENQYQVPNQSFFGIGLGMVAPTILAHGSDTAKNAYLQAMHRGDLVGCQIF